MIAEFISMYSRESDFNRLAAYALGITDTKSGAQGDSCKYLTDNNMHLYARGIDKEQGASKPAIAEAVAQQFHEMIVMNKAVRKPVGHITISAATEDAAILTEKRWREIVHEFMSDMGYDDTRWFASLHMDTENPHIHIMACTIQDLIGYPVVDRWNEYAGAEAVMRKLEIKHGLKIIHSPKDGKRINNPKVQTKKDALRQAIDEAITQAKEEEVSPTLLTLFYALKDAGIEMRVQWQRGKPHGLSFKVADFSCAGSKLGADKRYTPAGLTNVGIEMPDGRSLLELESQTASRSAKPVEENTNYTDHDIAVAMPKADSDLLLKNKRVAPPSFIEPEADKCIWSYRIRIYRPKPGTKLSVAEILKAVTKSLKKVLSSALKLLGHRSPSIETLEAEPAVDYAPLKATLCPGTRFNEDKAVDRICKVKQENAISEPALEQADSDTSDDSSAFPTMEYSETPNRPRGDVRHSWSLGDDLSP